MKKPFDEDEENIPVRQGGGVLEACQAGTQDIRFSSGTRLNTELRGDPGATLLCGCSIWQNHGQMNNPPEGGTT